MPDIDLPGLGPMTALPSNVPQNVGGIPVPAIETIDLDSRSHHMRQMNYPRPAYRFKAALSADSSNVDAYGKRLRKNMAQVRRTVDYISAIINYVESRSWQKSKKDMQLAQSDMLYSLEVYPPCHDRDCPVDCVTTKMVRSATNKVKCPIYSIAWTPEGRRIITGASSGEFTLWNGIMFNFETILQAHDCAVRAMQWSHNEQWMLSADHDGYLKYWQPNMNNVKMYQAHKEALRAIRYELARRWSDWSPVA